MGQQPRTPEQRPPPPCLQFLIRIGATPDTKVQHFDLESRFCYFASDPW